VCTNDLLTSEVPKRTIVFAFNEYKNVNERTQKTREKYDAMLFMYSSYQTS